MVALPSIAYNTLRMTMLKGRLPEKSLAVYRIAKFDKLSGNTLPLNSAFVGSNQYLSAMKSLPDRL
jgi:hypothetical protein